MLVRCKHTGLSWICLIVQFAAITWPLCPNKILETLQHGKVQIPSGGFLAEVQRSFQWSKPILQSKKLSDLKLNSTHHNGWRHSASITLELASTCSPGRCSQLCKQKRYNSSRAVTGRGQDQKQYILGFDENPAPRQHFSWKSPGKKTQAQAVLLFRYLKSNAGCILHNSYITKEKRRLPRIVRIVQMRTNEPAVASSTAILFLLGRPQGSNNTCLTKGPIDLQRNLIHLVTFC